MTADAAPGFPVPLCATPGWIRAVTAADGLCQCTGACGRKHTAGGGRCEQRQGEPFMLHLTATGAVYCPRCHDAIARSEARSAPAAEVDQLDLLALLD